MAEGGIVAIEVHSADLERALFKLLVAMKDATPAFKAIAEVMAEDVDTTFEKEGAREGRDAWVPSERVSRAKFRQMVAQDRYESGKAKKPPRKGSPKTLQDTGRLRRTVTGTKKATPTEASIGTNLIYAATHEFGDHSRNIPMRPFMFLTQEATDEIEATILDFYEKAWVTG